MTNKECLQCGKKLNKETAKFCSRNCQLKFLIINPIIRKKANNTKSKMLKGKRTIQIQRMIEVNTGSKRTPTQRKNMSEAAYRSYENGKIRLAGNLNPSWQGGKSFEEYGAEFDNTLKEQIRFRDGYKCRECGCSQLEAGRQLDVHHKDHNKKNNNPKNLMSLCRKCHVVLHNQLLVRR